MTASSLTSSRRQDAGKLRCSSTRDTSLGNPRSSRSAGDEVHGDREVEAVAAALADLLQRAVEHERGQGAAEPAVVGERQEVGRHQQPAPRVRPAHERLDAADRARRDLRLRLVVQDELAALQPVAQLAQQLQPAPRVVVARGQVDLVAGAGALGLVHGHVGALQQPERVARVLGEERDADRRVDVHADAADGEGAAPAPRAAATRRRTRTPRRPGSSTTANSSPPSRASVFPGCSASSSRGPIWRSTSSPA